MASQHPGLWMLVQGFFQNSFSVFETETRIIETRSKIVLPFRFCTPDLIHAAEPRLGSPAAERRRRGMPSQYSCGKSMQVEERSASVMIQTRTLRSVR